MRLSYSSLQLWEKCPLSWYARYMTDSKGSKSDDQRFGIAMHQTMEGLAKAKIETGRFPSLDISQLYWREMWLNEFGDDRPESVNYEHGIAFIEEFHKQVAPFLLPVEVEVFKSVPLPYEIFTEFAGIADVITWDRGIFDYKFTINTKDDGQAEWDLQPMAMAFIENRPISFTYLEFMKWRGNQKIIMRETERTQKDIDWFSNHYLPARVIEMERAIKAVESGVSPSIAFPVSPGKHCRFCAARPLLCEYRV